MDVCLILTYRCNSRCSMCYVWQNPTLPAEEISLATISLIPDGIDYLNLTGGEPTLRKDLVEIVDLLAPKAMQLEISSNGLHPERLEPIIRKHPEVKIRFSLDGFEATNSRIRGERDGFQRKVQGLLRLQELGGRDLGLAITIQDENAGELVELFRLAHKHGFELATSTLHNGFQFHKGDNVPYDRGRVAGHIEALIMAMLQTNKMKNWFRAYLNQGLMAKVLGQPRLLPCAAATDFVFVDPWSNVFACNVRPDLRLGNLETQTWDEIYNGPLAASIRGQVSRCSQNCWMVGSAKTAMRHPRFARLPKVGPMLWVMENKLRVALGGQLRLDGRIDRSYVHQDALHSERPSYLDLQAEKRIQHKDGVHYAQNTEYFNV